MHSKVLMVFAPLMYCCICRVLTFVYELLYHCLSRVAQWRERLL